MTQGNRITALLTATHRYDKSLSTRNRGAGEIIEAPILAYLIETPNGRILYDVGCDYAKISDPLKRSRYYDPCVFAFGAPDMQHAQRLPQHLARLGLKPADIDVVFLGHLHFDHAGGLCDVANCEIHVQYAEFEAAHSGQDVAYFVDDFIGDYHFRLMQGEYDLVPGVRAISSAGHTAGHMSLYIETQRDDPVILCGDAADLTENLEDEVAPGICWQEREDLALASIRKLKAIAHEQRAQLWPNHDMAFWQRLASQ